MGCHKVRRQKVGSDETGSPHNVLDPPVEY
jgi:hypothetical protein